MSLLITNHDAGAIYCVRHLNCIRFLFVLCNSVCEIVDIAKYFMNEIAFWNNQL